MTEYDYSEEGYVAFQKQQQGVGKWARQADKCRADFQNPFIPTPSERGRVSEYQQLPSPTRSRDSKSSVHTRTLSRQSGSISTVSTRKPHQGPYSALPGPAPVLPGPSPAGGEYRRARSMSQTIPPVPAHRQYQPSPHPVHHSRQQPVIPSPADHRSSSHSRLSLNSQKSRPPSRTEDRTPTSSRAMYYAHAPGNSPQAKGVYTSYMLPNTRIIQLPTPRANETFHMLPPAANKRYEMMDPHSKTAQQHIYRHDENQSGRRTAPPKESNREAAQAGLLKRFFGGIGTGNHNEQTRPRSTAPASRARTPNPEPSVPHKRLRRKSFF